MTSFWDELEAHIAALDEEQDVPDPWAGVVLPAEDLSDAQRTFLEGLEDQPPRPRLDPPAPGD